MSDDDVIGDVASELSTLLDITASPAGHARPPRPAQVAAGGQLADLPDGPLVLVFALACGGRGHRSPDARASDGMSDGSASVSGLGMRRSVRGGSMKGRGRREGEEDDADEDEEEDAGRDGVGGAEVLWAVFNVCRRWRQLALASPLLRPAWKAAAASRPKMLIPPSWWASADLELIRAAVDESSFQELLHSPELPAALPWGRWAAERFLPSVCTPLGPFHVGRNLYMSALMRHERALEDMCSGARPVTVVIIKPSGDVGESTSPLYARFVRAPEKRADTSGRGGQGGSSPSPSESESGTSRGGGDGAFDHATAPGRQGFLRWLGGEEGSGIWEEALQMVGGGEQPGFLNRLVEGGASGRFKDVFSTWDAAAGGDAAVGTRCVELRWDSVWRDLWVPGSSLGEVLEDTRMSLLQHIGGHPQDRRSGMLHIVAKIRRRGRSTVYAFFCVGTGGGGGEGAEAGEGDGAVGEEVEQGGMAPAQVNMRATHELRLREWADWLDAAELEAPGFQAARDAFAKGFIRGRVVLFATSHCPRRAAEVVVPYTQADHARLFEGSLRDEGWTWPGAEWDSGWVVHM